MAIKQLSDGNPSGTTMGQGTSDKLGFYGLATNIIQPSAVTTVDTTTVTTVDTTTLTAMQVMTATITHAIVTINRLVVDSQLQAETINKLVADSRAQAVAVNLLVNRLNALGLIA